MARLVRAKRKIKAAGTVFVPADHRCLTASPSLVYLIFNEGWTSRNELSAEALRLGRALAELMPDEADRGLVALHAAPRLPADGPLPERRARPAGRPGPRAVGLGADGRTRVTDRALRSGGHGEYVARRRSPRCTSRSRVTGRRSPRFMASFAATGSPAELNCMAIAGAEGPQAGLDIVDAALRHYRYLHSTRAVAPPGRTDEAREEYGKAIAEFDDTPWNAVCSLDGLRLVGGSGVRRRREGRGTRIRPALGGDLLERGEDLRPRRRRSAPDRSMCSSTCSPVAMSASSSRRSSCGKRCRRWSRGRAAGWRRRAGRRRGLGGPDAGCASRPVGAPGAVGPTTDRAQGTSVVSASTSSTGTSVMWPL